MPEPFPAPATPLMPARLACGGPTLDPDLLPGALALQKWLLEARASDPNDDGFLLSGFAEQLNALGIPVDRMGIAIDALHSEYSGVGRFWTREDGYAMRLFPHGEQADMLYEASPFAEVHRTGEWLLLDLEHTPDGRFGVVPDLKAAGYRAYLVVPILFSTGSRNGITFATRAAGGFSERDLARFRFLMPAISAVMEIRSANRRLDNVLRIYVGDEPHRAILSGSIRRGQVTRIRSAILFADMRNSTRITSTMMPEETVGLLNAYFDCLVPPVEAEGGEVLKYMGDGLLAIFRDRGDDTGGTAQSALTAALQGLARIEAANMSGRFDQPIAVGMALHHGEAAYGNVGAGGRLDFTVIGRDVNLASRLCELNKTLAEPLLMSQAFVDRLWGDPEPLGPHRLEGLEEQVPLYRPRPPRS